MSTHTVVVSKADLLAQTALLSKEGYRIVQICALVPYSLESASMVDGKIIPSNAPKKPLPQFEIYYSFDKDGDLLNLKLNVDREEEIPSISRNFFGAFLYENEINEQFGTKIVNIALDFKGTLYKKAMKAPYDVYAKKGGDK